MATTFQAVTWLISLIIMAYITNNRISVRERNLIVNESIAEHKDHASIARTHRLAETTIDEYVRRYKKNGHVLTEYEQKKLAAPNGKVPRKKIFDNPNLQNIASQYTVSDPTQSLNKIVENIYGDFGFYVSRSTVDRYYQSIKFNVKRLSPTAKEANEYEEYLFWQTIQAFIINPNQMLFIDESHRSDKTANKRFGRGPPGPVHGDVSFTRGHYKLSFISAVHVTGVKAYNITFGGYSEDEFLQFIVDEVINLMRPYPEPFSVLLLDNVSIHKSAILEQIIDFLGCVLIWIPRYCPLYNLAEYSFRDTKNIERVKGITGELASFVSLAESIESLRHKDYTPELRIAGYV